MEIQGAFLPIYGETQRVQHSCNATKRQKLCENLGMRLTKGYFGSFGIHISLLHVHTLSYLHAFPLHVCVCVCASLIRRPSQTGQEPGICMSDAQGRKW